VEKGGIKEIIDFLSRPIFASTTKVGILLALVGVKEASFSELQKVLGVSKSTLSLTLDNLEANGLIKSFTIFEGRPKKHIRITEKGSNLIMTYLEYLEKYREFLKEKG